MRITVHVVVRTIITDAAATRPRPERVRGGNCSVIGVTTDAAARGSRCSTPSPKDGLLMVKQCVKSLCGSDSARCEIQYTKGQDVKKRRYECGHGGAFASLAPSGGAIRNTEELQSGESIPHEWRGEPFSPKSPEVFLLPRQRGRSRSLRM